MRQACFPFLIMGWRHSLIRSLFREGERFVFRTEQTILNNGEEDEPVRSNAAQAEKNRTGIDSCAGLYFQKMVYPSFLPFERGNDGIMVRLFDGGIDLAIVRLPVGRAKHIVDAHVDGIAVERTPDAVGSGHIGICESRRGNAMMGIRNGRVVEITAKDDALASLEQALHVGRRDDGLARAYHRRIGDFGDEHARTAFRRAILWIDHHLVVLRTIVLREVHAL